MSKHNTGHAKKPSKKNYNAVKRWVANKARKIAKHLKKYPNDNQSKVAAV